MSKESVRETQLLWLVERAEAILAEQGVPKAVCCAAEAAQGQGSGLRSPSLLYVVALEGRRFPLAVKAGVLLSDPVEHICPILFFPSHFIFKNLHCFFLAMIVFLILSN